MNRSRTFLAAAVVVLGASFPAGVLATDVCGTYTSNQTWTTAESPYIVTCSVFFAGTAAPVLAIQAGVTVKFCQGCALVIGNGSAGGISVQGTSSQHVTFTANQGTPTAGYWSGIQLQGLTTSTSTMAYADVLYSSAGVILNVSGSPAFSSVRVLYASGNGLTVQTGSPTISGATLSNNQWGFVVTGGAPTLNGSSTVSSNTIGGVWVGSPGAPSLQTVTISNNAGYAVSQDAGVTFGTVSSLTINSNTYDAVQLRTGSTLAANATWKNVGIPYVAAGAITVGGVGNPVLTIAAGVTVKFPPGADLAIGYGNAGKLSAVGTTSQPIVLTSGQTSPSAGSWAGLRFFPQASTGSNLRYATVSFGGSGGYQLGGITVTAGSPTLDHVTFDTNAYAGVSVSGSNPAISNCNFTHNAAGVLNQTPTTATVNARMNFWGSLSGPSGSGPGLGQSVSTGVTYEPWLGSGASAHQFFTAFSLANSTFNPNLAINANLTFSTAQSGNWTLRIYDPSNSLIRTITGTGASGAPTWDGKNDGGSLQPNATYTYQIDGVAGSNSAAPLRGRTMLDTARQLTLSGVAVTPAFFSPNADGVQDTSTLSGTASLDGASWTLNVKNSGGTVVRSASGSASPNLSYTWNGKNTSGAVQPDGVYTLELTVTDGSASASSSPTATLDRTLPVATISWPSAGATLSNVYQSGVADVTVTGTSTDTNLASWTLDYGAGPSPTAWTGIATGSAPVSNAPLGTWSTLALANGQYTVRLAVVDKAGNQKTAPKTVIIGNFNVIGGSQPLNPATSGTVTFTSVVPFTVTETFVIKNSAGQIVNTLFSGTRNAGSYSEVWNGKTALNVYVPAGIYTAVATATAGSSSMTWNPPPATVSDSTSFIGYQHDWWNPLPAFWPFNNLPLSLTYLVPSQTPPRPARAWILFTPDWGRVRFFGTGRISMCGLPGNFCSPAGRYLQAGTYTTGWLGFDNTRVMRPDIQAIVLMITSESSGGNVIMVAGSEPAINNLQVAPPYFRPGFGSLQVSFNAGTFQSGLVTVIATFERLGQAGALKTITRASQPPGVVTLQWDGRSDSGFFLDEGSYLVTITLTDALGSAATQQALITIGY